LTVSGPAIAGTWTIHPVAIYDLRDQSPTDSGDDDTAGGTATSLTLNLNRKQRGVQVLCRVGSGTTADYSSSGFTSHTHSISGFAGGAVVQGGLDSNVTAATPAALSSITGLPKNGAFAGATWR
jgi:hypothetical protein